jgi:hypothetical protein
MHDLRRRRFGFRHFNHSHAAFVEFREATVE